jgi:hypothetical protein
VLLQGSLERYNFLMRVADMWGYGRDVQQLGESVEDVLLGAFTAPSGPRIALH